MRTISLVLILVWSSAGLPSMARAQTFLGDYTGHAVSGRAVTVSAGAASVRFVFYRPDLVRVDYLPDAQTVFDSSLAVVADTSTAVSLTVESLPETLVVNGGGLRIHVSKSPLRFSIRDDAGAVLLEEPSQGGLGAHGTERFARFRLRPADHFYGTGERGISLDLRGQAFDLFNTAHYGYGSAPPTMAVNVTFVASLAGYGLYFDTSYPMRFDLGAASPDLARYSLYEGPLRFFVIAGATVAEQIEDYTWLTGRQPLPPLWSLGYIQSKFGYRTDAELRDVARALRERDIPCDAVVIDLDWFREMGDLAWNRSSWPDPAGLVHELLTDGLRTILITEPYVTRRSLNFAPAVDGGFVGRRMNGTPYLLSDWWSCGCDAVLLDLTDPDARSWWWSLHRPLLEDGIGGLWTDLGEPERHPWDMVHHLGGTAAVHNAYNLLWARTLYEGFSAARPDERPFNLTRSGSAGIQRYGVQPWSGDVSRSFSGLEAQLPLLLQMGMSGLGYFNSDIGGFCCGSTTPELYVRWMQFGAFCPVTRAHGTGQPTEPWAFGLQAEQVCREFLRLRYRLLPYLYTLARENHETGLPIARPVFFENPDDPTLRNLDDSFLFGNAFLVSPVTREGQRTKPVRLPPGDWIDFWTDRLRSGDTTLSADAPLESMPVFVRAGSLVPARPPVLHTGALAADTLIIWSYPADGSSQTFMLYEDDGLTRDYERGAYAKTPVTQTVSGTGDDRSLELTVGPAQGTFAGAPARRAVRYEVHGMPQAPRSVTVEGAPLSPAASRAAVERSMNGFYFDRSQRLLIIQIEAAAAEERRVLAAGIGPPFGEAEETPGFGYALLQNSPNPFAGSTRIPYSLRQGGDVEIAVYDIQGRLVHSVRREGLDPGDHVEELRIADLGPRTAPSGVYLYELKAWSRGRVNDDRLLRFEQSRKMTVLN